MEDKKKSTKTSTSTKKGSVKKDLLSTISATPKTVDQEKKLLETLKTDMERIASIANGERPVIEKKSETPKKSTSRKTEVVTKKDSDPKTIKETTPKVKTEAVRTSKTTSKVKKDNDQKVIKEPVIEEILEIKDPEIEEVSEIIEEETPVEEKEVKKEKVTRTRKKTKREVSLEDYNTNYITKSLSQTIHESMIPYSEFVIMDRAIPRVEDGLKPVQRRVLFSMLEVGVLPDRPFRKSASIVGDCMGKYHPHGDTSIYDALVRLAQPFNMCEPLVNGHGNFGSVDGDGAAAMRYTEAKLTPLALELLRDLDKNTVSWSLNFDDRLKEPDMLPGRFPNLLVNGCQGIAVGLATNIPPHNFAEACNAVIAYIDNKKITLDEIMKIMPSPDFPSGGYILDNSELRQMYETGKGKIYIRSKIHIENSDNGKKNLVITEIPYQVNKANMLQKIAKYREANPNGPLSAIQEIVDESDRSGTRAVIKLKKDARINAILNILYKYCDVQTTFGANIVAIADGKPKQMGVLEILKYYVDYQQQVIYNRTNYDLEEALKKEHILEGLLIAIKNIDRVIKIIKSSKNTTEAKINLIKTFDLSEIQAQAILDMRLAKLTSLEVDKLITELNRLKDLIKRYTAIIKSPTLQLKVVKSELKDIVKAYARARKTRFIKSEQHFEDESIVIDDNAEVEETQTFHFMTTPMNTLKSVNLKSYNLATKELSSNPTLYEIPSISFKIDDNQDVFIFTNLGNCVKVHMSAIPECKFRDKGLPLFNVAKNIDNHEEIVSAIGMDKSIMNNELIFVTKKGMIKISKVSEYISNKQVVTAIKLGGDDELLMVDVFNPHKKLTLFTEMGNGIKVETNDIAITSRNSSGIKGIALDKGDKLVGAIQTNISDAFTMFMSDGSAKIIKQVEVAESARNRKGLSYISSKSKTAKLIKVDKLSIKSSYVAKTNKDKLVAIMNTSIPLDTRTGSGKVVVKEKIDKVYSFVESK